jgi:hypothetical protein
MSTSFAFTAGWRDRLQDLPPQAKYAEKRQAVAMAYERGRHLAAIFQLAAGYGAAGTINAGGPRVSFKTAYKRAGKKLRDQVRQEQKFARAPKRKLLVDRITSGGK